MIGPDEFRAVFESLPDGVLIVGEDGKILAVSPEAAKMFGWARDELVGEAVEVLVPVAAWAVHRRHRARYRDEPHVRPMGIGQHLMGRRRDGLEFPVQISLSPWEGKVGRCVICAVRDMTEYERLQAFSNESLRSVERERKRMAQELHDDTCQRLAVIMMQVSQLGDNLSADAQEGVEAVLQHIEEVAVGLRSMARGLLPPELTDRRGLKAAIAAHAERTQSASKCQVRVSLDDVDDLLSDEQRLTMYRVFQEAISNAVRHSGSAWVEVSLRAENDVVVLTVGDGGKGFVGLGTPTALGGMGLMGMRERAGLVGGQVEIRSDPGAGTHVSVRIPRVQRIAC